MKLMRPAVISMSVKEPSFLTWRLMTGLSRSLIEMAPIRALTLARRASGHRSVIAMDSNSASV
ncbi:hypothetical protein D3C71_1776030 [compost metagenome]